MSFLQSIVYTYKLNNWNDIESIFPYGCIGAGKDCMIKETKEKNRYAHYIK